MGASMEHDTPRLEIERWLEEATAGLDPADAELVRQELELHIYDLLSDEIMSSSDPQREAAVSYEDLVDYLGTLNPSKREDLHRAVKAKCESLRQGLSVFEKVKRLEDFSLTAWIQSATRGLCDDAKARIATEIEAHYTDAFDDAKAQGLLEPIAHIEALTSLGDSHSARRAFRKTYLTEAEDQMLLSILRDPKIHKNRPMRFLGLICIVPQIVMAFMRISSSGGSVWPVALFTLLLCTGIAAAAIVAPRLLKAKWVTLGLTIFLAGATVAFFAIFLIIADSYEMHASVPTRLLFIFAPTSLFWGLLALRVLPMIRKLRRNN